MMLSLDRSEQGQEFKMLFSNDLILYYIESLSTSLLLLSISLFLIWHQLSKAGRRVRRNDVEVAALHSCVSSATRQSFVLRCPHTFTTVRYAVRYGNGSAALWCVFFYLHRLLLFRSHKSATEYVISTGSEIYVSFCSPLLGHGHQIFATRSTDRRTWVLHPSLGSARRPATWDIFSRTISQRGEPLLHGPMPYCSKYCQRSCASWNISQNCLPKRWVSCAQPTLVLV